MAVRDLHYIYLFVSYTKSYKYSICLFIKKIKEKIVAFNASNFVKSISKTFTSRIVDNATNTAISGGARNAQLIAKNTAQSLFNIGASFDSIEAFSTQKTDTILSNSSDEYFALAGKAPSRLAASQLSTLRRTGNESSQVYFDEVNPQTKVANAKNSQEFVTLSAL